MRSARKDTVGNVAQSGELDLIRQIRTRSGNVRGTALRLGIGDDCALLRPRRGEELAITTDLSIAGQHFRLDWHPPQSIGHRALARGLSDLAAMGARPVAAFLSLGLPRELTIQRGRRPAWVKSFFDGLLALAAVYKTPLAGGDLSESPIPIADVVLGGAVPRGKALLRSTARPGHIIYVTGTLGGAAAALCKLAEHQPCRISKKLEAELGPHLYPQPRVAQGLWLVRHNAASAAIDISDGLSTDLTHLCEESGVASEVDAALLPVHSAATVAQALNGGEDYELLFTAPANARIPSRIAGVPITKIGRIVSLRRSRATVTLLTRQGSQPLNPQGWQHFS
jgi:thiamine-monophosphate kinase